MRTSSLAMAWSALCSIFLACAVRIPPDGGSAAPPIRSSPVAEERDFAAFFRGIEGTFVLLDPQKNRIIRHDADRARARFLPASTFKIPNTLIALETGVASGPDFALSRDPKVAPRQPWWPAVWSKDHVLGTALKNSVVWFYQELARRVGAGRMQAYVDRFDYGNKNISGGIDQFWLTGDLRISADEQVEFLRRFYFGDLGVSERNTRTVKELLLLEETPEYRLSGKTGWAGIGVTGKPETGWLVGYLERDGNVYFFATNISIERNEDAAARLPITRSIFAELGLITRR